MAKKWYSFFVVSDTDRPADEAADAGPAPRAGGEATDEVAVEFDGTVTDVAPLEAIYDAARIPTPDHGYTILKVAEMLQSEHIRELPPEVRRKSVLVALDAAGVPVQDVVDDAVRRDRALDTYERVLEQNLDALRAATATENARLETEIEQRVQELRVRIAENQQSLDKARRELAAWRVGKQAEEARIAAAVGHFVAENPVSLSSARPDAQHTARPEGGEGVADDVR